VKDVHPSSIRSFATFALLLDLAEISTEFIEAITTQFFYLYTGRRHCYAAGLHARLCHAFLV